MPFSTKEKIGLGLASPIFVLDFVVFVAQFLVTGAWIPKPDPTYSSARGEATETHGAPRSSTTEPELKKDYEGATTVYEMIQAAIAKFSDKIAMQSRKFVEMKKLKETDRFPSKVFDDAAGFNQITYKEFGENIVNFGAGLRELGMNPIPDHDPNDFDNCKGDFKMVIYESTCSIWTTALQGAFTQSMTVATCYATLGNDAVIAAVQETEAAALLVNWKSVAGFAKRLSEMPSLKVIIASTNEMPAGTQLYTPSAEENVKVVSSDEVMALGKANSYEVHPPKPSDVAVIMYTSGSTGKPKGVIMRHSQLVAGIGGMALHATIIPGEERYVSFLPLAHILALQIENVLLCNGATMSYTDPREMAVAMSMFKPTIFAAVPKVYEMLRGALEKKLAKGPEALQIAYKVLLAWKTFVLKLGGDTPVTNNFFALISSKVFGNVPRFAITGGGPMGSALHLYSRACFNCPVVQGYALTETCVGGCLQLLSDQRMGYIGAPVPCVEIALQSEPEVKDNAGLPYLHTDRVGSKGEKILGRGEICIRGPCVSSGYYKNPEKTKEEYDNEGFFHSGDIGQFTEDGVLQIIDRKKNLVKLKGGEYVAVEAMEIALSTSPFVETMCVLANGDMDGPLVLVRTDNHTLKKWAEGQGMDTSDLKKVAETKEARDAVLKSMLTEGKAAGLTSLELRIKDCCLITDVEWLPGKGMTASMKLDRKAIHKIHAKEIEELYARNGVKISS
eukprot:Nitzschia sp. Nitz4//scaffold28_size193895//147249//149441//NITZ4_001679-RA/size193895-processed-gene-0.274-mRNA-1//-1//CDS//3329546024//2116//frame0